MGNRGGLSFPPNSLKYNCSSTAVHIEYRCNEHLLLSPPVISSNFRLWEVLKSNLYLRPQPNSILNSDKVTTINCIQTTELGYRGYYFIGVL